MQRLTLAQQISQLENPAPTDFDPEDIYGGNTNDKLGPRNDEDVETNDHDPNAGREHYVDVGPSELRKLRESVSDPKYTGVRTSRHQLHANEDEGEDESEEGVDRSQPGSYKKERIPSMRGDSLSSAPEDEEAHSSLSNGATKLAVDRSVSTRQQDHDSKLPSKDDEISASSLQRTRLEDKLKGKAVSRQLKIWDSLVDARIRLQKCVTTANILPYPENLPSYASTSNGRMISRRFLTEVLMLSDELFELRHTLLTKAGSAPPPLKRRRIDPEQEDLDLESLVDESTTDLVAFDTQTHPYTLSTLQKWSAKVQAVAPSALLPFSRTSFKSGPTQIKSAAELVEEALRDQSKGVKRTWGKFNQGARIGGSNLKDDEGEGDEETFDDRDFYQAMLRDVIESKGSKDGVDAAELYANSKRQKKKKNVDAKATKGRKLRYEPHEKLQNFMVPVPVRGAWHEEQIDELFASLLGKGFEGDKPALPTNGLETGQKESEIMQSFRLFG